MFISALAIALTGHDNSYDYLLLRRFAVLFLRLLYNQTWYWKEWLQKYWTFGGSHQNMKVLYVFKKLAIQFSFFQRCTNLAGISLGLIRVIIRRQLLYGNMFSFPLFLLKFLAVLFLFQYMKLRMIVLIATILDIDPDQNASTVTHLV